MDFILTLVASGTPLSAWHLAQCEHILAESGTAISGDPGWLAEHKAAELPVAVKPDRETLAALRGALQGDRIDLFISPSLHRRKKLLIADMDSTIVTGETLDELTAHAGKKDEIATVTKLAMEGQLDFRDALRERVGKLPGLPAHYLQTTLDHMELSTGAEIFVKTMARNGAICVLVSGGFTFFTGAIAEKAGFHHHHGNVLAIENETLTGAVEEPILDKDAKLSFLHEYAKKNNLGPEDALAIGDGANDLPMLETAGLGIGYRPKPVLIDVLDNLILYGDLTAALYAQGYKEEDFAAPLGQDPK